MIVPVGEGELARIDVDIRETGFELGDEMKPVVGPDHVKHDGRVHESRAEEYAEDKVFHTFLFWRRVDVDNQLSNRAV